MMFALILSVFVAQPAAPVSVTKITTPEKALRLEVVVPGSLDEVWSAFSTREGVQTWLWRDARVELRPGGDWLVLYPGEHTAGGTIVSFDPKRTLTVKALAPEQFPTVRETGTTARFEFAAVSPTQTRVTLIQTGWQSGKEWDDAYEYLAAGNAELLGQLHRRFASGPLAWPK